MNVRIYFVDELWDVDNFGEYKTINGVLSYSDNRFGGHVHIKTDSHNYEYEGWEIYRIVIMSA